MNGGVRTDARKRREEAVPIVLNKMYYNAKGRYCLNTLWLYEAEDAIVQHGVAAIVQGVDHKIMADTGFRSVRTQSRSRSLPQS